MSDSGPWTAPNERRSGALGAVAQVAPLALGVSACSSVAHVLAVPALVPALTPGVAGTAALAAAVVGILAGYRQPAAAWVATLALPLALIAGASALVGRPEVHATVPTSLYSMAGDLVWSATFDGVAVWLFVGGRARGWTLLPRFLALYGFRCQLVDVGFQFLLPGLAFAMVLSLLEVVVARGRPVSDAVAGLARAPLAAVVSFTGAVASWLLSLLVCVGLSGLPPAEAASLLLVDPLSLPLPARAAAEVAGMALWGLALATAGAIYDERVPGPT